MANTFEISVIIPFLNEESCIPNLTTALSNFCKSNPQHTFEVLFIDDGSTDNSVEILGNHKHEAYSAKIISLSKNFGSHAAIRAGMSVAKGRYCTFTYADLQDPLSLITELHEKASEGFDIVWAARKSSDIKGFEKLTSKMYASLMRRFAVKNFPDSGYDIVLFSTKVLKELNRNIESNSSVFLQILDLGYRQTTIFYIKQKRKAGKSKWTFAKKLKLVIDSFVSFSYFPIRLVSVTGILLFATGLCWAFYILLRTVILNDMREGWPTLISVLMIGFGITNISLGIIAEYLWRTLDAARNRPVFNISEIIELNSTQENE